jgi:hypothetical protein
MLTIPQKKTGALHEARTAAWLAKAGALVRAAKVRLLALLYAFIQARIATECDGPARPLSPVRPRAPRQ